MHRARNLHAKLPERERERVEQAYRQALDDAISDKDSRSPHETNRIRFNGLDRRRRA